MKRLTVVCAAALALGASSAEAQKSAMTTFAGTVVDSAKQALGNAEVALPALGMTRTTNDKGIFRIENIPAGVHRVTVKHIGYGQLDTTMTFTEDQTLEWRVTLGRIVLLDSVRVTAPLDPMMAEFESNRARGFGRFMTRADLAKRDGSSLPAVLQGLSGASIMRTNVSMSFITSKRVPASGCITPKPRGGSMQEALAAQEAEDECLRRERIYYVPDEGEKRMGVRRACYPVIYVGRNLMNSGVPTPPFDISSYATEQIEALEWYEGPSQTPARYNLANAKCGVLVLHLRERR